VINGANSLVNPGNAWVKLKQGITGIFFKGSESMIKFFSSVKLAVVLIASLIIASIFATLYPKVNVFSSFWFRGLLLLFTLNLAVCTFKRLPAVWHKIFRKGELTPFILANSEYIKIEDSSNCAEKLLEHFKGKGYRIQTKEENGQLFIQAEKGFLNLIAPHLLHFALIVVLIGAFLGSFGTKGEVRGYVGQTVPVSNEPAMTVKINDFETLYDEDGAIDNWVSHLTLYVNNEEVKTGTTRVNHPFKYKGTVFYQSSYGYTHVVELVGEYNDTFALPDQKVFKIGDIPFNINQVRDGALLKIFRGHEIVDSILLAPGDKFTFPNGTTLTYLELIPFTILSVKKDPGTPVVMLGFVLVTIASTLFWTGRYQEIKVILDSGENALYYRVNCKNKTAVAEISNEVIKKVKGE